MKKLTIDDIRDVEQRTQGKPYPVYASVLKDIGIEKYEVTLKNHERIFTYAINESLTIPGHLNEELSCAESFELSAVVEAIRRNQAGETDYSRFLHDIATAGVHHYTADLAGMQIIYNGKKKSQVYAEPIPSI